MPPLGVGCPLRVRVSTLGRRGGTDHGRAHQPAARAGQHFHAGQFRGDGDWFGPRHAGRCAARPDAGDGCRARAAVHLQDGCRAGADFADCDVCLRHLRRRDYVDPVPYSGRTDGCATAVGRLRDDAPWAGGPGARLFTGGRAGRRIVVGHRDGGALEAGRKRRAEFLITGIFRNHCIRARQRCGTRWWLTRQRPDQPVHRPVDCDCRRGLDLRCRASGIRSRVPAGRH